MLLVIIDGEIDIAVPEVLFLIMRRLHREEVEDGRIGDKTCRAATIGSDIRELVARRHRCLVGDRRDRYV